VRVVCRSVLAVFLGASALVIDGLVHPGCLEAIACREALDLALDLNLGPIKVASDCLEVVQGLSRKNVGVFGSILKEIECGARFQGETYFSHERQELNMEAHKSARHASALRTRRLAHLVS
jgi:hypothetical protein